ncbi:MAG TPA: phosphopyruvate hydratase [Pirellulales bacterium]|nr:phosphopyruvate hydratase [Pirellulales bacterium]
MAKIQTIQAREVLDSRGNPTIEVEILCDDQTRGAAMVPSGASTGRFEACELRDGDPDRYDGKGVLQAVAHVNELLRHAIVGLDPADQTAIDQVLLQADPSPQKARLGGNALLGVSLAAAQAGSAARRIPLYRHLNVLYNATGDGARTTCEPRLPCPMTNMISGGLHAGGNLDFQDFLILPVGAPRYAVGLEWIVRVYRRLGELLSRSGYEARLVGDEGGYGPRLKSNAEAAEFIVRAIEAAQLRPGEDVALALDVAATHFFDGEFYQLVATGQEKLTSSDLIERLVELVDRFPIVSIEDGLAEDDWTGWRALTARLGKRVRLVGDDLLVTNSSRLQTAIERQVGNAVLIKVNQIGTLSETMATMRLAESHRYLRVVSARSGETEDTLIADLAVGAAAEQIKIGCITRSERLAKYNRLLRIAEQVEH